MLAAMVLAALVGDPVAVALPHDGKPGVWFTQAEAERLNTLDLVAPLKDEKITVLEAHRSDLMRSLKECQDRPATVEPVAWYRAPVLWFSVGVLLGASVVVFAK